MARARPALAQAVNAILERHGANGKKLSYRQAERLTGLSPATIGELAKGNARTSETVRRFARGMGEDLQRLMLLAGFVPEDEDSDLSSLSPAQPPVTPASLLEFRSPSLPFSPQQKEFQEEEDAGDSPPDEREWLGRFGRALAKMPPGRERDLWKDNLHRNTELLEAFLERMGTPGSVGLEADDFPEENG